MVSALVTEYSDVIGPTLYGEVQTAVKEVIRPLSSLTECAYVRLVPHIEKTDLVTVHSFCVLIPKEDLLV